MTTKFTVVNNIVTFRGLEETAAHEFAVNLRKDKWKFGTDSCGNDAVIFFSKFDRQVFLQW